MNEILSKVDPLPSVSILIQQIQQNTAWNRVAGVEFGRIPPSKTRRLAKFPCGKLEILS